MASKLAQPDASPEDIADLLDAVDKNLDRLKTLYEQYFLGIQKQAPAYIHTDVERKLRDLTQIQIRNTGLRYRFATIQSKFGSYNAYWRRTLRQIENGTYARNLHKIGRDAVRSGAEIPEEILAAMPKRMRDQVVRDREQALAIAARRRPVVEEEGDVDVNLDLDDLPPEATEDLIAMIKEPTAVRRDLKTRSGAHILDTSDSDLDIDAFFAEIEAEPEAPDAPDAPADDDDAHSTQKRAPVRVDASASTRPTVGQKPLGRPATDPTTGQPIDPNVRRTGPQAAIDASGRPATGQSIDPNLRRTGPQAAVDASGRPATGQPIDPNLRRTGPQAAVDASGRPIDPNVRRTGPQAAVDASGRPATGQPVVQASGGRPATGQPIDPNARRSGVQAVVRPTEPDADDTSPIATSAPVARPPTAAAPATPVRPVVPAPARPSVPAPARPVVRMPSQATKPNPITPGAAAARGDVPVESMSGPFPRAPIQTPISGMPSLSKPGGIPRPLATTPSGGMPAIPRPTAMTPTGGMPAIPKPMSTGNTGPMSTGGSGPVLTGKSGPTPAVPKPIAGPSSSATSSSPTPSTTGVAPQTVARAATSPHTVPRAATAPGGTTAPSDPRPPRPDTSPGVPTDMSEDAPAIVTQTRPTVRAQSPRPGTAPARAATGQPARPATAQPKPAQAAPQRPPPGMTDADVNALYAKYVKAKEMVGEKIGPGEHNKLLKTINAQAPKIMQQYNAKAVDFSVVVKDNQVIIRAKPKT